MMLMNIQLVLLLQKLELLLKVLLLQNLWRQRNQRRVEKINKKIRVMNCLRQTWTILKKSIDLIVVVHLIKLKRLNILQKRIQTQHHQIQKKIRRRIRSNKKKKKNKMKKKKRMKKKVKKKMRKKSEEEGSKLRKKMKVLRKMSQKKNEMDIFKSTPFLVNINTVFIQLHIEI